MIIQNIVPESQIRRHSFPRYTVQSIVHNLNIQEAVNSIVGTGNRLIAFPLTCVYLFVDLDACRLTSLSNDTGPHEHARYEVTDVPVSIHA